MTKAQKVRRLTAKNPSEARGIRKALRALGQKYEFRAVGNGRAKKRNPAKKRRKTAKPRRRKR